MATVKQRRRAGKPVGWEVRWRDTANSQRKRLFTKKSDADRFRTSVEHQLLTGTYVDPASGRTTVGEWSRVWLDQRVHLKPKTLAGYESLLRSRILPRWAEVQLGRVAHADVVAWVSSMKAEGLSPSRTRAAYHLLKAMLDDAVKSGKLVRNVAAGVDLPRLPVVEPRYLTHVQVAELVAHCGQYGTLVHVLAYCGLRWGEATALQVRSLDLLRGRIQVVQAVSEVNGQLVLGPPKSHQTRSVPIPRFLCDDLAIVVAGRGPRDLVFTSPEGFALRVGNWRRHCFDRAATAAGLKGLVPHELRHTAASLAIASGANVKAVQRMLGHASATLTLDRYGHLFDDELDAVSDKLDRARRSDVPQMCPKADVVQLSGGRSAV